MNNNNQNGAQRPAESNNDLSWQAFCYVANELDAKARRQFEIRLEQDQITRDAVAQACLLYTSPSPRDKRQSRMPSSA